MNKSGFSLVELLCVIAVIALVGTIATIGVMKISDTSDSEKLRAKKELLLESAILYGEDKKSLINQKCTVNNEDSKCLKIKVQDLLDNKYYFLLYTPLLCLLLICYKSILIYHYSYYTSLILYFFY